MQIGKVKWFSNVKGYGFIVTDEIPEDLFAHYSAIEMEGYRSLRAGQVVEFTVEEGDKGLHAVHIRPQDEPTDAPHQDHQAESGRIAETASH